MGPSHDKNISENGIFHEYSLALSDVGAHGPNGRPTWTHLMWCFPYHVQLTPRAQISLWNPLLFCHFLCHFSSNRSRCLKIPKLCSKVWSCARFRGWSRDKEMWRCWHYFCLFTMLFCGLEGCTHTTHLTHSPHIRWVNAYQIGTSYLRVKVAREGGVESYFQKLFRTWKLKQNFSSLWTWIAEVFKVRN